MTDGAVYACPVKPIAESQADYYKDVDGVSMEEALEDVYDLYADDVSEIRDWATNNMEWSDLRPYCVLKVKPVPVVYDDTWQEAEFQLV